jgi:hypothetical protein
MPLAHPLSATPTSNFSETAIAVTFATSRPGENVKDFRLRIGSRGPWGQSEVGRDRVELVLTKQTAERLIEILGPFVGFGAHEG